MGVPFVGAGATVPPVRGGGVWGLCPALKIVLGLDPPLKNVLGLLLTASP
jgi:hypothetical protein